jgi:hypothetical protein
MAVSATQLVTEITNRFPSTWDFSDPSTFNRRWLDALCAGFQTMWQAGVLTPGPGPPPGPNLHTHVLVTGTGLVPASMSGPPKAVGTGKDGLGGTFADTLAVQTSSFLIVNTKMTTVDGTTPHIHSFTTPPGTFGQGTALATQIKNALASTGNFRVEASAMPQWLQAFSDGLIAHLTAAATMTPAGAAVHVHPLL